MAIFHYATKIHSRSTGSSAAGATAYCAGAAVRDPRDNTLYNFSEKNDVVFSQIYLPEGAPEWMADREALAAAIEAREDRSTRPESAQLMREIEAALPREIPREERIGLAEAYVQEQFVARGMVVDLNIHEPLARDGNLQPHMHALLTLREVTPDGFGNKVREWNDRALVSEWREAWAEQTNAALEQAGVAERVSHLSYAEQGIDKIPEPKIGAAAMAIEARGGVSQRGEMWREVQAMNQELEAGSSESGNGKPHAPAGPVMEQEAVSTSQPSPASQERSSTPEMEQESVEHGVDLEMGME